jgi:hypothetical protein
MPSKYSNKKTPEERYAFWHNELGQRRCSKCEQYKELDQFNVDKNGPSGRGCYCKACASENSRKHHHRRMKEDPSYAKAKKSSYILWKFGITLDEYNKKLEEQNYKCSICETEDPVGGWHLDHNHSTGAVREFLCCKCNAGIGYLNEDPRILSAAIAYLHKHSQQALPAKESANEPEPIS